jgi:hypothetical protein
MDLQDLRIIRDELEKLTEGFRAQNDLRSRLHMIDQFRQILLELRVKAQRELEFDSLFTP